MSVYAYCVYVLWQMMMWSHQNPRCLFQDFVFFTIFWFKSYSLCASVKPFSFSFKPFSPFLRPLSLCVCILNVKKWAICSFEFENKENSLPALGTFSSIFIPPNTKIENFLVCENILLAWKIKLKQNRAKQKGGCRFKSLFRNLFAWICTKKLIYCVRAHIYFWEILCGFFPRIKVIWQKIWLSLHVLRDFSDAKPEYARTLAKFDV